jgi:hypothetical protein
MARDYFNMRETDTFVTDGAGETYFLCGLAGGTPRDDYPTVRNGHTFGIEDSDDLGGGPYPRGRDRNAAVDPRLAGAHFCGNSAGPAPRNYRFDYSGAITVGVAAGEEANAASPYLDIRDSAGSKTIVSGSPSAANFLDAMGTNHTLADWAANNVGYSATFADYVRIRVGDTGGSGNSMFANVWVEAASGGTLAPLHYKRQQDTLLGSTNGD